MSVVRRHLSRAARCGLAALAFAVVAPAALAQMPTPVPSPHSAGHPGDGMVAVPRNPYSPSAPTLEVDLPIAADAEAVSPTGLAWAADGLLLVTFDHPPRPAEDAGRVLVIDGEDGSLRDRGQLDLPGALHKPGDLAVADDLCFGWVVGVLREPPGPGSTTSPSSAWRGILGFRLDRPDDQGEWHRIELPEGADFAWVRGLEWFDGALWLAVGGGLCSCVYQLEPEPDRSPLLSFFPRCEPLGLAVDPSSRLLWLAADNGAGRNAFLLRRSFGDRTTVDGRGRPIELLRTVGFQMLELEVRPTALAARGNKVWVLDGERRKLLLYE